MRRGSGSLKLASVFGIRIGVNPSWFLILFIIIFTLSSSFRDVLDSSDTTAYATAVIAALLFFVSLVLHELGHALMARRLGIGISGIELFLFGGWATMTRDTESPGEELKVAAAGPFVTLLVLAACLGGGLLVEDPTTLRHAMLLQPVAGEITPAFLLVTTVASWNAFLLVFNLIPALPLDGGRIARAVVWRATGDRIRATRVTAGFGQLLAYALGAWGFVLLVRGDFYGLYALALAFFLWQAARGLAAQAAFSERIEGVRVADIMDTQPVSIPTSTLVGQALDDFFRRYGWSWFPAVDHAGRFVGLLREDRVRDAVHDGLGGQRVDDLTDTETAPSWRVRSEAPIESLLHSQELARNGALMAVDADGVLRGVVTLEQVRRAIEASVAERRG